MTSVCFGDPVIILAQKAAVCHKQNKRSDETFIRARELSNF